MKKKWIYQSDTAAQTESLGKALATQGIPAGTVIALVGQMGAGKTHFVKGLAAGLGVAKAEQVVSPTYAYVQEYSNGQNHLVHFDFYRLHDVESAISLGLDEQLHQSTAVVVVEWADQLLELIPDEAVWIRFVCVDEHSRQIEVDGFFKPF